MYYVYITTNKSRSVLYIGVTNNLQRRIFEHKNKLISGFTKRYNVDLLVYYEEYSNPQEAIAREKSIKNLVRRKKEILVSSINPDWLDLSEKL